MLWEAGCRPLAIVPPQTFVAEVVKEFGDRAAVVPPAEGRSATMLVVLGRVSHERIVILDHRHPFVTIDDVRAVVRGLDDADACVAAVPVMETLKRVKEGVVDKTADRAGSWHELMPQAFRTAVLAEALDADVSAPAGVRVDGSVGEVDAVLRAGGRVVIVEGHRKNMTIRTAGDLELASSMMEAEG